jgi:hypothetical protein
MMFFLYPYLRLEMVANDEKNCFFFGYAREKHKTQKDDYYNRKKPQTHPTPAFSAPALLQFTFTF